MLTIRTKPVKPQAFALSRDTSVSHGSLKVTKRRDSPDKVIKINYSSTNLLKLPKLARTSSIQIKEKVPQGALYHKMQQKIRSNQASVDKERKPIKILEASTARNSIVNTVKFAKSRMNSELDGSINLNVSDFHEADHTIADLHNSRLMSNNQSMFCLPGIVLRNKLQKKKIAAEKIKRKFVLSLHMHEKKLESNAIFQREWIQSISKENAIHKELMIEIEKKDKFKEKLRLLLKFKLNNLLSLLKGFQKVLSQEKITQALVHNSFLPIRVLVSSAFFPQLSLMILRMMTEISMASKDLSTALKTSLSSFVISDIFEEASEMLCAIEIVGNCQRDKRMYQACLESYFKQLYLAWALNDVVREIRAYDNIGMAYFYQNQLDKAFKYHNKAMNAESELEFGDAAKKMGERYNLEKQRKRQLINSKDQFFRYSVMKQILTEDNFFEQEISMNSLTPLMTNFSLFDESPIRPSQQMPSNQKVKVVSRMSEFSLKMKKLREKQFKCNFTKEGLMHSLVRSNPMKRDLIQSGVLHVDSHMLKDINLCPDFAPVTTLLTHQSQNKSADSFISYHNFVNNSADICLEYISADIKQKIIGILDDSCDLIGELLQNV